jgi:hypothetical protein
MFPQFFVQFSQEPQETVTEKENQRQRHHCDGGEFDALDP